MPDTDFENLAAQWSRQRGFIVDLPSGKKARIVRTLDITAALKAGTVPNPLRSVLLPMIEKNEPILPKEYQADPLVIQQMTDLMNQTICAAFIDPKVVMPPEEEDGIPVNPATWMPKEPGTISIVDLSNDDRVFVYGVAQGGTTDLESFRSQQKQLMATLGNGKSVSVPPKRATGARKK